MSRTAHADVEFINVNGVRLYARDYNRPGTAAKAPVVCLHGATGSSARFAKVAPLILATGRRVIALDKSGHGRSGHDPNPENYNAFAWANDDLLMLDTLDIERAFFIGTSVGAIETMIAAALRPGAVLAAVLNDMGPEFSLDWGRRQARNSIPAHLSGWDEAAAFLRKVYGEEYPNNSRADWLEMARPMFRESAEGLLWIGDPAVVAGLSADLRAGRPMPDLWPQFRLLTNGRPCLMMRGALSTLLSPELAAKARAAAPAMAYVEVAGVGHSPNLTEPEAWTAIEKLLDRVP